MQVQLKGLAQLERLLKKVFKLKHDHNPQLGQVFIGLIDAAFEAHRQWQKAQEERTYRHGGARFILDIQMVIEPWLPKTGYAADLLLRSLRKKAAPWCFF